MIYIAALILTRRRIIMTEILSDADCEFYAREYQELVYSIPKCLPPLDVLKILDQKKIHDLMVKAITEKSNAMLYATEDIRTNQILFHTFCIQSIRRFLKSDVLKLDTNEQLLCDELAKKLDEVILKHSVLAFTAQKIKEKEEINNE
jgi:hypothetical protein